MRRLLTAFWVAFLGCGSVESGTTDASDHVDGSVVDGAGQDDAMVDAATMGPVTVTVLQAGGPVLGALVFYHDPSGMQVDQDTTDSAGESSKDDMPVGGFVTIIRDFESQRVLESVGGVQIGDSLVFDTLTATFVGIPTLEGTISVDLPQTVVDSYVVESNCRLGDSPSGAPDEAITLNIRDSCPDFNNIHVVAYGLEGGVRTVAQSTTTSIGASVNFFSTDPVVAVELTAPAVEISSEATFIVNPQDENGTFDQGFVSGVPLSSLSETTETFRYMPQMVPSLLSELRFDATTSDIDASHRYRRRDDFDAAAGSTMALDATDHFPLFTEFVVDTEADPMSATFGAADPLVCGGVGEADALLLWVQGTPDGEPSYVWNVVLPGDTPSPVALPRLSGANQAMYWPSDTFLSHGAGLQATAYSDRDYDQFRNGSSVAGWSLSYPVLGDGDAHCRSTARVFSD